jgi:hypothetical protein
MIYPSYGHLIPVGIIPGLAEMQNAQDSHPLFIFFSSKNIIIITIAVVYNWFAQVDRSLWIPVFQMSGKQND